MSINSKTKKPLLSKTDGWWFYTLMFIVCLTLPIFIILIFSCLTHYLGGIPWPKMWGDMGALAAIYSGLVAAITLLFGISSLIKSRRDKAWDDQFRIQECLHQLNREWFEIDQIKDENKTPAYHAMTHSARKLRNMAKARGEIVRWDLVGLGEENHIQDKKNQANREQEKLEGCIRIVLKEKTIQNAKYTHLGLYAIPQKENTQKKTNKETTVVLAWPEDQKESIINQPQLEGIIQFLIGHTEKSTENESEKRLYYSDKNGNWLKITAEEQQFKIKIGSDTMDAFCFLDSKGNQIVLANTNTEYLIKKQ